MIASQPRANAILKFETLQDLTGCIGEPVEITGGKAVPCGPETDPVGVIVYADERTASIAIFHGGLSGTVKVKLKDAVYAGTELYLAYTGGKPGFANRIEENFAGESFVCAIALEPGVEGELVEAVLFRPVPIVV